MLSRFSDECHIGCVCKPGYVRDDGFLELNGFENSKCKKEEKCEKPRTEAVNFVEQTPTLPEEVDVEDPNTWEALAEEYDMDGVEIIDIVEIPAASSLNLADIGSFMQKQYHVPIRGRGTGFKIGTKIGTCFIFFKIVWHFAGILAWYTTGPGYFFI